jgi:aromatic-L-amino-acid/L-tryptophan decarboxylase
LVAPAPLNIVNFRYVPVAQAGKPQPDAAALDALNREILIQLQERGIAVPSGTTIHGRFAIRVAITNHRSRAEDFDALVQAVVAIGQELGKGTAKHV